MGIFFVNKLHNLPPIALAIIVGTIIGGLLNIEKWIERAGTTLRSPLNVFSGAVQRQRRCGRFYESVYRRADPVLRQRYRHLRCLNRRDDRRPDHSADQVNPRLFYCRDFASTLGYIITVIFIPQLIVFIILFSRQPLSWH
jgi:uncharacterized membrane protein YqgA involved in biofilm formation